jgi:hypothetical protein
MTNIIFQFGLSGIIFTIDYEDKDKLNFNFENKIYNSWFTSKGYVFLHLQRNKKHIHFPLSNMLLGYNPYDDIMIDHKDLDKSNYRKSNLRITNHSQNHFNIPKRKMRSKHGSKFKGASLHSNRKKWVSQIVHNYKNIYLMQSIYDYECAYAYDIAAKIIAGEFAFINGLELIDRIRADEIKNLVKDKLESYGYK